MINVQGCEMEELEHYHCKDEGCETVFRNEDGVREHGRNHFFQDQISGTFFVKSDPDDHRDSMSETSNDGMKEDGEGLCTEQCPHKKTMLHFHCKWVST